MIKTLISHFTEIPDKDFSPSIKSTNNEEGGKSLITFFNLSNWMTNKTLHRYLLFQKNATSLSGTEMEEQKERYLSLSQTEPRNKLRLTQWSRTWSNPFRKPWKEEAGASVRPPEGPWQTVCLETSPLCFQSSLNNQVKIYRSALAAERKSYSTLNDPLTHFHSTANGRPFFL